MIKLSHIDLSFDRVLLKNAELSLYNGQVTGVIGESGCGKTTLLQEIGLLTHHKHIEYEFDNLNIAKMNKKERSDFVRNHISFILQDIYMFKDLSIQEVIDIYAGMVNKEMTQEEIYDYFRFVHLDLDMNTPITTMSGGEKQRLAIILGLVKDAQLFIFDEPTAYLDSKNRKKVLEIIKKLAYQENKAVLIASHDRSLIEEMDRIYEMKDQQLVLIKEKDNHEIKSELISQPFYFTVLKKLLDYQKSYHVFKRVLTMFLLFVLLMVSTSFGRFYDYYQKANGQSLLEFMKHEVYVGHKDEKSITPRQQAELKHRLADYEIYPDIFYYGVLDNQMVEIRTYLKSEETSFDIYKTVSSQSSYDQQKTKPIYISYLLYRSLPKQDIYQLIDHKGHSIDFKYSYALKPMTGSSKVIYMPYDDYIEYLKDNGIDINLEEGTGLKILINDIKDISDIEKQLKDPFVIVYPVGLEMQISIAQIFEQQSTTIFIIVLWIMLVIYKVSEIFRQSKDIALLKMLGVRSYNLLKMKLYEEIVPFMISWFVSIIGSSVILYCIGLLTFEIIIDVIKMTTLLALGLYVFLLIVFCAYTYFNSTAKLLKSSE